MILKIQKFSFSTILVLFPLLYFNSCTFEFIKPYAFTLPVVVVFLLAWLLLLAKERVSINLRRLLPMVVYTVCLLVFLLVGDQSNRSVVLSDISNILYMLIFMSVFTIYSGEKYKNDRALIVVAWFVDTIIACIYSIYRLINEPILARLLSTGSYHETDEAISARGIVSFGVIYGLVLVILALFYLLLQGKNKRFVNIFLISLFFALLLFAQFFLSIILVAIGVVWILFINMPKNSKGTRNNVIFLIIFGTIFIVSLPFLLRILAESDIFGYEINARLKEIVVFLNSGGLSGMDISARLLQYTMSLSAFFSSYGMGNVIFSSAEVGTHSGWLDGLGNYGILFLLYIFALFVFRRFVIDRMPNQKSKQLYSVLFAIYAIMSVTNTSTWAPITLSLCVIVPFLCLDRVGES